jgi:MFS family permease
MTNTSTATKRAALAVIAAAQFMVIMDTSIIGVALPEMQADLGFSPQGLSWVFNAYVVAFGGLLLLGGRLSDLYGARRIFSAGWAILTVGSLAAGLADTVAVELAGRAAQGAGAALIAPASLTLLFTIFGSIRRSSRRLSRCTAPPPRPVDGRCVPRRSHHAVRQLAVGVLHQRPARRRSASSRRRRSCRSGRSAQGSLDVAGAATVTAGLAAVVFAIVRAPEQGWASLATVGVGLAGLALITAFLVLQATSREPLMRLGILRAPKPRGSQHRTAAPRCAWIPMFFFLNLYLQQVLGLGAFASGAALLPLTCHDHGRDGRPRTAAHRPLRRQVDDRERTRDAGCRSGLAVVRRPDGSFAVDVLPASLVAAAGMAMAFIPSLGTALSAAAPEEGGLAAGIVNTSYQVGSALGLAAMTAVAAAYGADEIGNPARLSNGFAAGLLGAAGIALVGAAASAVMLRTVRAPAGQPDRSR